MRNALTTYINYFVDAAAKCELQINYWRGEPASELAGVKSAVFVFSFSVLLVVSLVTGWLSVWLGPRWLDGWTPTWLATWPEARYGWLVAGWLV